MDKKEEVEEERGVGQEGGGGEEEENKEKEEKGEAKVAPCGTLTGSISFFCLKLKLQDMRVAIQGGICRHGDIYHFNISRKHVL